MLRLVSRVAMGVGLLFAGSAHFLVAESFLAQVPSWLPFPILVIYVSGVLEIGLGLALLLARVQRERVGWLTAAFFIAVFTGNIWQWISQTDGFGLDSDQARFTRLFFQPVLVAWALWTTREVDRRDTLTSEIAPK